METVIALKAADGSMVLEVLGAPFGGPYEGKDSQGDYFDAETNVHYEDYPEIPAIYMHGFNPKTRKQEDTPIIVGKATYSRTDSLGHWYKVVLDQAKERAQILWGAALNGLMRASSGAINYLVRRDGDGHLREWPIAELTLMDVSEGVDPANPYAIAVPMLKADYELAGMKINLAGLSQQPGLSQEDSEAGEASQNETTNNPNKGVTMDETKEVAKELDVAAGLTPSDILESIQKVGNSLNEKANAKMQTEKQRETFKTQIFDALGGLLETAMKAAPAEKEKIGVTAYIPGGRKKDDYNQAFSRYLKTGDKGAYKALVIMNESDDESGGAAVPTDFYNKIIELRDPASVVRKMGAEMIPTSRLTINLPTEAIRLTAPADTAESAAATATSRTINEVEPLDTVAVTVDNYTYLLRISEENLMDDATNLESFISNRVAKNFAIKENSALKTAIYADVSNTVNAADDLTIAAGDVFNTYYDLPEQYADGAVWLMKRATEGLLRQLTGSPFAFGATPQGTSDAAGQRTLLFNPVFNLADMDAVTTSKKVIFFGDPYYVKFVQNGTMTIRRLNERYADTGEVGFVCSERFAIKVIGGGETWTYLLTLSS